MPYIKTSQRKKFFTLLNSLTIGNPIGDAGELNFILTCIVQEYISTQGIRYQSFNDAMGALEGCKLEMYRRWISPYEDEKIIENGDVTLPNRGEQ